MRERLLFTWNIMHVFWAFIPACLINAGIRVQSLKKGQITMDIDFRWGGDPSIILGVEAALVASIPIQVSESTTGVKILFLDWIVNKLVSA